MERRKLLASAGAVTAGAVAAAAPGSPGNAVPGIRPVEVAEVSAYARLTELKRYAPGGAETGMGAVVLTMDDAFIAMDTVRQMLDARGQRGTFCITPGLMNGAGKMTDSHIRAMVAGGHEIAAHSQTHTNFTTLTPAQRATELKQPKDYLEAVVGGPVTTFAYPFGSGGRNATTDAEVYPLYERVLDTALYNTVAMYPRFTMPPSLVRRNSWDETNQNQILSMIRQAGVAPLIACMFFHNLDTVNNPTTVQVIEGLDLAAQLGVPLVTVSEAFGGFRVLGNPSFEDSSTDVYPWRKFTRNAGTVEVVTVTPDAGLSGTQAVRLTATTNTEFAYMRQTHPVVPGRTYTLSFRSKLVSGTAQAGRTIGRIRGLDSGQNQLSDTVTTTVLPTASWQKISVDYTAGQSTAYVNVDLAVDSAVASVDYDHVWFGPKYLGDWG